MFDEGFQAQQALIPFVRQLLDPLIKFPQWFERRGIAFLASHLMHSHQTRIFKDIQVLEDTLPRDTSVFLGQLRSGLWAVFGEVDQQPAAHGISQCMKNGRVDQLNLLLT